MSRRARTSVNALLLARLMGIAAGTVSVLRRDGLDGQADGLEERMVAVEESMRPAPELAPDCDLVPIPSDVWRRIKGATGYGSFECDEHVAAAIEGLLKETRIAMPYATEIESLVRALAPIAKVEIDERFDPMESWRGIVKGIEARIARLWSERNQSSDLADGVTDELETVRAERDELRASAETQADIIEALTSQKQELWSQLNKATDEVARLNAELDAAMQRAVMPTFEPEPDFAFLEAPLYEEVARPVPEPGSRLYPRAVREVDEDGAQGFVSSPAEGPPQIVSESDAPTPEEPKGEPVDPAVGTGGFVADVPAVVAPTPKPVRKPKAAAPTSDPAPAVLATTGGWNLYASPEQAVAIARMIMAGVAPETISKELDAKPNDVTAVRELVSADLARVRKMLPMQREQWLQNKAKVWRKSFEGKEVATRG